MKAHHQAGAAGCVVRRSDIHGCGVFAGRKFAAGTPVAEYRGVKVAAPPDAGARANAYLFELRAGELLDGAGADNPARFLNHSCAPNCEAVEEGGRIFIRALRAIAPGEELTFDYGLRLSEALDHPCRCGAKNCAGYIVNRHDRARLRRMRRRAGPPSAR